MPQHTECMSEDELQALAPFPPPRGSWELNSGSSGSAISAFTWEAINSPCFIFTFIYLSFL